MNDKVRAAIGELAKQIAGPGEPAMNLDAALVVSYYDDLELPTLMEQVRAYAIVAHYYPHVTDIKRKTRGGDKLAYQFLEEYLEGRLKTLDKGIIASMHVNNMTGRHNV